MLTLKQIMDEAIWVVKMQGWRTSGTYAEIERYAKDEECRDCDLAAQQPEHLQEFFDRFWKWSSEHGFITVQDYYKDVYLVEENEKIAAAATAQKQKRVWTEDEIRTLIQTNDKVLYGALKKIYAEQTADEQAAGETHNRNGVGFNGVDAPILSSFAEFLNRTGFLTTKQKALARKKLAKYNKQLTRLANA